MGYSLFITRKADWSAAEPEISVEEWHRCVERDPELRFDESQGEHFAVWSGPSKHEIPWLCWDNGNIESKDPDVPLIKKMCAIAESLGAKVQGEEGELYNEFGKVEQRRPPGAFERLKRWWANASSKGAPPVDPTSLPFVVGDRVRSIVGPWYGVVTQIDLTAEHGLGRVTVRRDDGQLVNASAIAHGLYLEARSKSGA